MLSKFKMLGYKIVATLLVSSEKLKNEDGVKKVDAKIYMSLIDIFLYLTTIRPDIIFATSLLPRFRKNPGQVHFETAKRVLRYFQETIDFGIQYETSSN